MNDGFTRRQALRLSGATATAAAVAAALASCRGLVPHAGSGDPKTFAVSWWAEGALSKLHVDVVDGYLKQHPTLSIKPQYGPQAGYDDKLSTQLAGGNAPDVFMMRRATFADYISRGAVRQLDDLVPGTLPFGSLPESVQRAAQYKGHWYAIPLGLATSPAIIADSVIFSQLGLKLPPLDWTFDGFEDVLKSIHSASGKRVWGHTDIGGNEYALNGYMAGLGKPLFTDGGSLGFSRDELGQWLERWDRLRKDDLIPPMKVSAAGTGFAGDPLVTGKAAMTLVPSSKGINGYQSITAHPLELLSFPRKSESGPSATYLGPMEWFALSSKVNAAKAQRAAAFCLYFANNVNSIMTLNLSHGVPLTAELREKTYGAQSAGNKKLYDNVEQIQKLGPAPGAAYPPGATEVLAELANQNQQVGFGKNTVDQAVEKVFASAKQALA